MKFHLENIGCIEKADIELGNLTIICGHNNTGKTYVSYSIYGFLETWRENINFDLSKDKIDILLANGVLNIDLKPLGKNLLTSLNEVSKDYTRYLPKIFNSSEDYFGDTLFNAIISQNYQPNYEKGFESSLKTAKGKKEILKISKDQDSLTLKVTLLVDSHEDAIPPKRLITDFIDRALGEIFLGSYFANPFVVTNRKNLIFLIFLK